MSQTGLLLSHPDIFCVSDRYIFVSLTDLFLRLCESGLSMYLRQVYFCASNRVISLSQTGLLPCLRHGYFRVLSPVYFCVSAIIISVLCQVYFSVLDIWLFLCLSQIYFRVISVSQTGVSLCPRQGYFCVSDRVISVDGASRAG